MESCFQSQPGKLVFEYLGDYEKQGFLKSDHSWYTGRTPSSGPKIKVPCTFEHFPYRATDFYPVKSRVVEVLQYFAIL